MLFRLRLVLNCLMVRFLRPLPPLLLQTPCSLRELDSLGPCSSIPSIQISLTPHSMLRNTLNHTEHRSLLDLQLVTLITSPSDIQRWPTRFVTHCPLIDSPKPLPIHQSKHLDYSTLGHDSTYGKVPTTRVHTQAHIFIPVSHMHLKSEPSI